MNAFLIHGTQQTLYKKDLPEKRRYFIQEYKLMVPAIFGSHYHEANSPLLITLNKSVIMHLWLPHAQLFQKAIPLLDVPRT